MATGFVFDELSKDGLKRLKEKEIRRAIATKTRGRINAPTLNGFKLGLDSKDFLTSFTEAGLLLGRGSVILRIRSASGSDCRFHGKFFTGWIVGWWSKPWSIFSNTFPKLKISARASIFAPWICSGAANSGVPNPSFEFPATSSNRAKPRSSKMLSKMHSRWLQMLNKQCSESKQKTNA